MSTTAAAARTAFAKSLELSDELKLSKSEIKSLGVHPATFRRRVQAEIAVIAAKLAVAEHLMLNPPLYGHHIWEAYIGEVERCGLSDVDELVSEGPAVVLEAAG